MPQRRTQPWRSSLPAASLAWSARLARSARLTRSARLPGIAVLTTLLILGLAVPAARPDVVIGASGRLITTLSAGFDSFGEKYSIDEADTLDYTNELRSIVGLQYTNGWGPGHAVSVRNHLSISNASLRNLLRFDLDLVPRPGDRFTLSNELVAKRFDRGEDYVLSSDHIQEMVRAAYRLRVNQSVRLRLGQRFELMDFRQASYYEYDYRRSVTGIDLDVERGIDSYVNVGYALAYRAVPDSSEVRYLDQNLHGSLLQYIGMRSALDLRGEMARRRYGDPAARPGYFYFDLGGRFSYRLTERVELRLRQQLESYSYDVPSEVYFNYTRYLGGVEASFSPHLDVRLGIEPRLGLLRASAPIEEYREISVVLAGDWIRVDGIWLTASLEIGKRRYLVAGVVDPEALTGEDPFVGSLYSDYAFNRVNLFSTVEFRRRYALNLFLSFEPERHVNDADDTTTTLVSTDLTVRF
jgi:hypothetical protein